MMDNEPCPVCASTSGEWKTLSCQHRMCNACQTIALRTSSCHSCLKEDNVRLRTTLSESKVDLCVAKNVFVIVVVLLAIVFSVLCQEVDKLKECRLDVARERDYQQRIVAAVREVSVRCFADTDCANDETTTNKCATPTCVDGICKVIPKECPPVPFFEHRWKSGCDPANGRCLWISQ